MSLKILIAGQEGMVGKAVYKLLKKIELLNVKEINLILLHNNQWKIGLRKKNQI